MKCTSIYTVLLLCASCSHTYADLWGDVISFRAENLNPFGMQLAADSILVGNGVEVPVIVGDGVEAALANRLNGDKFFNFDLDGSSITLAPADDYSVTFGFGELIISDLNCAEPGMRIVGFDLTHFDQRGPLLTEDHISFSDDAVRIELWGNFNLGSKAVIDLHFAPVPEPSECGETLVLFSLIFLARRMRRRCRKPPYW